MLMKLISVWINLHVPLLLILHALISTGDEKKLNKSGSSNGKHPSSPLLKVYVQIT